MSNHSMNGAGIGGGGKNPIVDIKELIEGYARAFFKENEREYYKMLGKSSGWKEFHKEINWKRIKVKHESPLHTTGGVDTECKPKASVLFKSTFCNDTTKEQEYALKTERRTTSSCEFEIYEGYTTEGSAELSLEIPVPGCVMTCGTGIRREYAMDNTTRKSFEEEISWAVESNIKVPGMSKTTAELVVQEDEYKGEFEVKTYFSGGVSVRLIKDNVELAVIDFDDLGQILTQERGFKRDKRGIYRVTRGECKARYGIEQKIELHQLPLANAPPTYELTGISQALHRLNQ